jgi:hypothetical protein
MRRFLVMSMLSLGLLFEDLDIYICEEVVD